MHQDHELLERYGLPTDTRDPIGMSELKKLDREMGESGPDLYRMLASGFPDYRLEQIAGMANHPEVRTESFKVYFEELSAQPQIKPEEAFDVAFEAGGLLQLDDRIAFVDQYLGLRGLGDAPQGVKRVQDHYTALTHAKEFVDI